MRSIPFLLRVQLLLPLFLASCITGPETRSRPDDSAGASRPNVVLIVTDDQGWGDFGFQGNPVIRTPRLDRLAEGSARLESFYVHPVCTPTRAALMTARAPQRTRAFDTWIGRAMMEPEEVTVAEALRDAGWATGIFGKWHLGDCPPMRAIDQGFEEALVHRGGGIGQPADPEGGEGRYTDPVLFHNGERVEPIGYCTDIYFEAAQRWIRSSVESGRPFFAYLPTNAPHAPYHDVPEALLEEYAAVDLSADAFPSSEGHPLPEDDNHDRLARIFAMITNIDENVGRLLDELETLGISEDTLVLFLVDNGPNTRRWVGGRRGSKAEVYEGGVRSPFLARWPGRLEPGVASDRVSCDMDVMPTILEACGVAVPAPVEIDGRSLLPLLERREVEWNDRAITLQAHRGDHAVRYHNFFTRTDRWKLLNASGFGREVERVEPRFELYDMVADPLELVDVATDHPEVVRELCATYDAWFDDVSSTRPDNFAPPRIHLGEETAPWVDLTRQDWRRLVGDGWGGAHAQGEWAVQVVAEGPFDVRVRLLEANRARRATLRVGLASWSVDLPPESKEVTFEALRFPLGPAALRVDLDDGERKYGPYQVEVRRVLR
jgi:arylsulfatase A-like enzyme